MHDARSLADIQKVFCGELQLYAGRVVMVCVGGSMSAADCASRSMSAVTRREGAVDAL
jgi:hypothetical protein